MQEDKSHTIWALPPDRLNLPSYQVDVWRILIDLTPASVKFLESTLSADEAGRATRFHFPADGQRFIAAHGCLRDILARYLNCQPGQLIFSTNAYGKPVLQGHTLEFNLSHSGDYALVAVTQARRVGIDVERIRANMEFESIARRFFSQNEVREWMSVPPDGRPMAFFHCWTRKEAYIKAQGMGISLPLESFDVSLGPDRPALLRATRPDPEEAARWKLLSLEVDPYYAAAVAVEGVPKRKNLQFRLWDWNSKYAPIL
jgi:4'-phosphopantetheinyl transferase